jgi:flagellar basal-body rod protein FlgB
MNSTKLFGPTIEIATRAMDLRARKHELILSNVANADTPGYKAFDIMVEEALAQQRSQGRKQGLQRTHHAHLPAGGRTGSSPEPRILELSTQVTLRGDGNTVDMDREMSNLAANQLHYKTSAQILSTKFKGLLEAIKGGGR